MAVLLGKDAKTYHGNALLDGDSNTAATVTWTERSNLQDENDNFSAEEIDVTTRASAQLGWGQTLRTTKNAEITFTILMIPGDEFVSALMSAFLNSAEIPLMFLNGDKDDPGNFGVAANWSVSMTFAKPVKGVQTADVSVKVSSFPEWVETGT